MLKFEFSWPRNNIHYKELNFPTLPLTLHEVRDFESTSNTPGKFFVVPYI